MNDPFLTSNPPSQGKCPRRYRFLAWVLITGALAMVIFLLLYLPIVVEIALVSFSLFVAIVIWRSDGFGRGLKYFIKEILFGL
jgi:hypothetical protein